MKKGFRFTHCKKMGHELTDENVYITPDGRRNCRACRQTVSRRSNAQGYNKQYYKDNKVSFSKKSREYKLSQYGLTTESYSVLLQSQGNLCAICQEDGVMNIDHDHSTGKVRGILCNKCNQGLGLFRDNIDFMKSAISYLEKINA